MNSLQINIKLVNPLANPLRQVDGDVGADVQSMIHCTLNPGEIERIPLGFAVCIPSGYACFVVPRSGLSLQGRSVTMGTIDPSYRGELNAIAYNSGKQPWVIHPGDRIAQLVILPAPRITFEPCSELAETARGSKGFGSSGVKTRVAGNGG